MAQINLPRTGLTTFTTGTDSHPTRAKYNAELQKLESSVVLYAQGVAVARPASGKRGVLFWDETNNRLEYDNGTSWRELMSVGGGGGGRDVTAGTTGTGSEGSSTRAARADHTHVFPMATTTSHGAMSAADRALLASASAAATPMSLVRLDSSGRTQFANPSAAQDAATKIYVDSAINTSASSTHTHWRMDATMDDDSLRVNSGNFAYYDGATAKFVVANTGEITMGSIAWSKVSGKPTTFAPSSHSHAWNDITSKPSTFAPSGHEHSGLDNGAHYLRLDGNGRVYGSALYDRTYNSLPNAIITSEGTIGRATRVAAAADHTHPASDITSGTFAYDRIRGTNGAHDYAVVGSVPGTSYSVWVDGAGRFGRNTSARRFKRNIRNADFDPRAILNLVPRVYDRVGGPTGANEFGMIADEVNDHLPMLVIRDSDGDIDGLRYDLLAAAMVPLAKQQDARITTLEDGFAEFMEAFKGKLDV